MRTPYIPPDRRYRSYWPYIPGSVVLAGGGLASHLYSADLHENTSGLKSKADAADVWMGVAIGGYSLFLGLMMLVQAPAYGFMGILVGGGLTHVTLVLMKKANATFEQTLRAVSYANAPYFFYFIPCLGPFVAWFWIARPAPVEGEAAEQMSALKRMWRYGAKAAAAEVEVETGRFPLKRLWFVLIRFVCPIAIVAILVDLVRNLL